MDLDRLKKNFDVLDSWEDRYRFIIEMGRKIPPVPDEKKTEDFRVHGCMSTVHMVVDRPEDTAQPVIFLAESDAAIVNGLIAVLHVIYDGKTADEMAAIDIKSIFRGLGLESHISPNRRNGFFSMVERLQSLGGWPRTPKK